MQDPIVRRGELTQQSLVDALTTEYGAGREPVQLAVGSQPLERVALQILSKSANPLTALIAGMPNVIRDESLPEHGWELREL